MGVINFSKANCKNCYKCVRECPVKSIRVKNEQAEIVEELCVGCGNCLRVCPQNAKEVKSELNKVIEIIKNGNKVCASIAPSFYSFFSDFGYKKFVAGLRLLGFTYIEETSVAAKLVTDLYNTADKTKENVSITTSCPSSNYLIRKYFPSAIKYMINVKSPMLIHADMIKQKYGSDTKVVFIGPCLAKKLESRESINMEAVLTFEELDRWFKNNSVDFSKLNDDDFDNNEYEAMRLYPISGGSIHGITTQKDIFKVEGANSCINFLTDLQNGRISNVFAELNFCYHSCINGPAVPDNSKNLYYRKVLLKQYSSSIGIKHKVKETNELDFFKNFTNLYPVRKAPKESEIVKILFNLGKKKITDELNCGACGYNTCRDKAKAVFYGMAEKYMCLPFMRQRAELISNSIFDNTPGMIFILNHDLTIMELNPSAEKEFFITKEEVIGKHISFLMDVNDFEHIIETKESIISKKYIIKNYGLTVIKSVLFLENQNAILIIMHNITEEEKKENELKTLRMNTIDMAQEVINKQMRVAQEIASLLGETTAETKITLTNLKKMVLGESEV